METTQVIGYRVKSGEQFVHASNNTTWTSYSEPTPCSQADAYRRVAQFITDHPSDVERFGVPSVVSVTSPLSPIETASGELGDLLQDLCRRHGLNLGLSKDQIRTQIAKELASLGGTGIGGVISGLIGNR